MSSYNGMQPAQLLSRGFEWAVIHRATREIRSVHKSHNAAHRASKGDQMWLVEDLRYIDGDDE